MLLWAVLSIFTQWNKNFAKLKKDIAGHMQPTFY